MGKRRKLLKADSADRKLWKKMAPKRAVMNIFTRVAKEENFGQLHVKTITIAEIATLLKKSEKEISDIALRLLNEGRIQFNGIYLEKAKNP